MRAFTEICPVRATWWQEADWQVEWDGTRRAEAQEWRHYHSQESRRPRRHTNSTYLRLHEQVPYSKGISHLLRMVRQVLWPKDRKNDARQYSQVHSRCNEWIMWRWGLKNIRPVQGIRKEGPQHPWKRRILHLLLHSCKGEDRSRPWQLEEPLHSNRSQENQRRYWRDCIHQRWNAKVHYVC